MTRQQTREALDQQNALLRAYGYTWKRREALSNEQEREAFHLYVREYEDEIPEWILLSPFEMPVRKETILVWLDKAGSSSEEVFAFLDNHGFVSMGKDQRQQHWQIQTPSGNVVNLKQALQEIERIRIDRENALGRGQEQKRQEQIEQSAASLKAMLDLHGEAMNEGHAWGFSPYPMAKRLADGTIEVTTYHFDNEYQTEICQNESDVVSHLFADGSGSWDPGTWVKG